MLGKMTDLSTGKSVLVLATVIGCFAILWPRIFYPMMRATFSLASNTDQDDGERPKPSRVRGHPPGHPTPGARIPDRMREMIGEGRGDIDPLTTITLEDGRPLTRPGVRGPSTRPQQKTGGTMSIVMPVYTIGIVGFFLYTILKLVFKNKNENEENSEIDQKGYSSTMKKLGVDPAKLSKLRECVYNSGQNCQDIDEYAELLARNRQQQEEREKKADIPKPKMSGSDLRGKSTRSGVKTTKKNPFQGFKKQEDEDEILDSEEEEDYENLRKKDPLPRVEKRRLESRLKNNRKHHQSNYKQMRDVRDELRQKLRTMEDASPKTNKNDLERKPFWTEDPNQIDSTSEWGLEDVKPRLEDDSSNQDRNYVDQSEDEWEDNSDEERESDLVPGTTDTDEKGPGASNDDDKILQILDLLIREKVRNGGDSASETTKTILRLRQQLGEKRNGGRQASKRIDAKKNT